MEEQFAVFIYFIKLFLFICYATFLKSFWLPQVVLNNSDLLFLFILFNCYFFFY